MQTNLADFIRDTAAGREADRILRACVHCGFCNATCPTYQLLGDELDGPRGRVYLMKQMLEGQPVTDKTRLHLDRCLTCRNCESTCPSGVAYGRLVDIGREVIEHRAPRSFAERLHRGLLRKGLLSGRLFALALGTARLARPLLPAALRSRVPERRDAGLRPAAVHARRMLLLGGCVQPALSPDINAATARVLDRLGISLVEIDSGCCGAIDAHLGAAETARERMRRNIDLWWPHIEAGAEALVITASGCGALIKDYGKLLAEDQAYAAKAERVAALAKDLSEVLSAEDLSCFRPASTKRIAFHPPCTLQHGQQLKGIVEAILARLGYELTPVKDSHLCCGSAGTYSILQPDLSRRSRTNKVANLENGSPELIATSNIGCQTHLEAGTELPVVHWITLLDES